MTIPEEIEELKIKLEQTTDERELAELLLERLKKYSSINSTYTQPYIDRLLQLAEKLGEPIYIAWGTYYVACRKFHQGEYERAMDLGVEALHAFKLKNETEGIVAAYNHIGNVLNRQGNYSEALENHYAALKLSQETADKSGISASYISIGNVHENQGDYPQALENYFASLKLREAIDPDLGVAACYNNIGLIYYNQGNYPEALKIFTAALKLQEEIGYKNGMATSYNNIGNIYDEQRNYPEALKNHFASLKLREEAGDKHGIAFSYNNIGIVYESEGNYPEALKNYFASLKLKEETGNKRGITVSHINIGNVFEKQGDYAEALKEQLLALQLAEEIANKGLVKDASLSLTRIYKAKGDFESALKYYEKYNEVEKEMLGEQAQNQLTKLIFKHKMELSEKETLLLVEKNEAIQGYVRKLEMSNNELNQFAHVASHDLREPLRMISSYMALLKKTLSSSINQQQNDFFEFAINGAHRMEELIVDLLRLAKIDADPKIEKVSLRTVAEEISKNLEVLLKEKNARITASDLPEIMADKTQMLQLFQNIAGNGIKYNEHEQPLIEITYRKKENEIEICIADNGIGIPEAYREKAFQIFQRVPTAKKYPGTGLGLALCKKIVESMNGKISIEDNPAGGTVFRIQFPDSVLAV